jgi:hypothetical protein
MRIDIIHMRDPDYGCEITVYVDGQSVNFEEWSFDPGAGYSMNDFEDNKQSAIEYAPEFLKPVLEKIYDDMQPTYERWSL